jgi:hypothetical protein
MAWAARVQETFEAGM